HVLNMELVVDVLEAAGYSVLQAPDAERGIALARAEKPQLVLMDVGLPGIDGLTATAALKSDPLTRAIPVVALTSHAMTGRPRADPGRGLLRLHHQTNRYPLPAADGGGVPPPGDGAGRGGSHALMHPFPKTTGESNERNRLGSGHRRDRTRTS